MDFKQEISKAVKKVLKKDIILEVPPDSKLGDFAFPCFNLAKEMKKAPVQIAKDIASKLKINGIDKIQATGPYVNFFVDKKELMKDTLNSIHKNKNKYGSENIGKGKTIVIDYSSPNIAKPFGIAHIRSTVIGNSLYKIHSFMGYKVVRVNHLGDWGTQFGKLLVAFKKWGDQKKLDKEGLGHLVNIYVKFAEEAKLEPELEDEAREWFKKLEEGDKEALRLWKSFRDMSIKEFKKYYKQLNVDFDSWSGESFYNNKLESTVKQIQSKTKTEMSEGALIVNLEKFGMPPLMLRKSDGTSTYHTRDLAAIFHRLKEYNPEKILYVVAAGQNLHFQQVFKAMELIGEKKDRLVHVPFGNMTYEGSMMSTRAGNFVLLEEVIDKAIGMALKTIEKKNEKLKNKKEVSEIVGIGAIVFGDLVNDRVRDVNFSWEKSLDFEGETAPYLQYTYARICSLLEKSKQKITDKVDFSKLDNEVEIVKKLENFNETVMQSLQNYKPHIIARYLLDLAQTFNSYYQNVPILNQEKEITDARLLVADCVKQVISNGLELLGIKSPQSM